MTNATPIRRTISRKTACILLQLSLFVSVHTLGAREDLLSTFFADSPPLAKAESLDFWVRLVDKMNQETEVLKNCAIDESICTRNMRSVNLVIKRSQELSRSQQIRLVNRYVNRFNRYRNDKRESISFNEESVKVAQEWVSLLDFLRRGGDCEDYATSKYQLFRLMGFSSSDLRIVVVYDRSNREHHALVAVLEDETKSLLLDTDNRIHSRRPSGYRLVYSLNEDYVWDHGIADTRYPGRIRKLLNKD